MPDVRPTPPDEIATDPAGQRPDALQLRAAVESVADDLPLPGVAAALLAPGREPIVVCTGLADVATNSPVTPDTAFRIGSISKTMTTLLVLKQVERGRLRLDDAIADHVDVRINQPRGAQPITVRDLLTHRAGLGELPSWSALRSPLHAIGGGRAGRPIPSLGQLSAAGYTADAAPGTKWVYANPAYTLLGVLVEELSDRTFAEAIAEDVFAPAGMDHATVDPADAPDLATGHAWSAGAFKPVRAFEVSTLSAGGVICTIDDLAAYAQMLLDGGMGRRARVIDADLLAEAFRLQFQPHPAISGIGLTFRLGHHHGLATIGHTGGFPGWNAGMLLCPERGLAAVALTNRAVAPSAEFGGGRLVNSMLDLALDPVDVVDDRELRAGSTSNAPIDLDALVGTYRPARGALTNLRAFSFFGGQLRVSRDGDHLQLKGRGGPLRSGVELMADEHDPLVYRFDFRGVRFALAFDEPVGTRHRRRSPHLWMQGIPTAFSLHRVAPPVRTGLIVSGTALAAAAIAGVLWRRRRRG